MAWTAFAFLLAAVSAPGGASGFDGITRRISSRLPSVIINRSQRQTSPTGHHQPITTDTRMAAGEGDGDGADSAGRLLPAGYRASGLSTAVVWAWCAYGSLATYKPHRITHNSIGVAQALTVLPLIWGVTTTLAKSCAAESGGRSGLRSPECRRLNLGLAAASTWAAITAYWSPVFTAATVRTSDPVIYPPALRFAATAVHLVVAAFCALNWRASVASPSLSRIASGFFGSVGSTLSVTPLEPPPKIGMYMGRPDDPDVAIPLVNEYSALVMAFAGFTALSIFSPFPLATVPSLLGKRMARAFGAWTLLASVALYTLRESAETDQLSSDGAKRLRYGLAAMAVGHFGVTLARPFLESVQVYPAAIACLPAVVTSLSFYALLLVTALAKRADDA